MAQTLRTSPFRKRWLLIGLPTAALLGLMAIAPPIPEPRGAGGQGTGFEASSTDRFRTHIDAEAYALDFDPRAVKISLFEGWDREQDAFNDTSALAFVSGPMYERHVDADGRETTVPLGDIKLGRRVWMARNRSASEQRAFVGIRYDGQADFGFGALTPERSRRYDTFIGGLHSLYNDLESPPASYRGAYSVGMGQQIRYYLPRIREIIGLRADGRIEVLMSRDGLTLEQTSALARERGLRAAYLPDHASKSRFILPGVKGFTTEDANWISGGSTSFVHVPYMLRLSSRAVPLQGSLLSRLPLAPSQACASPFGCAPSLASQALDRVLAGFNRLMEEGVAPIARLIWAPRGKPDPARQNLTAPLREPPITADPAPLRERQERGLDSPAAPAGGADAKAAPPPPDLPPPVTVPEGAAQPTEPNGEANPGTAAPSEPDPTPTQGHSPLPPPPVLPGAPPPVAPTAPPPVPPLP